LPKRESSNLALVKKSLASPVLPIGIGSIDEHFVKEEKDNSESVVLFLH